MKLTNITQYLKALTHRHYFKPIVSRYVCFEAREILYECSCGKKELIMVYRKYAEPFPIETSYVTSLEIKGMMK
jgi:hypothetical protein